MFDVWYDLGWKARCGACGHIQRISHSQVEGNLPIVCEECGREDYD